MKGFTKFDAAEFLDNEEIIAEYLAAALEADDPDLFITALGNVAKARGMTQVAAAIGVGRESLYKSFKSNTKLRYETVRKILDSFGVRLTVEKAAVSQRADAA
ncbi:MAG: addiction module antidote protein [Rhizobiaceae bacterium]